jgi:hypothetical protein
MRQSLFQANDGENRRKTGPRLIQAVSVDWLGAASSFSSHSVSVAAWSVVSSTPPVPVRAGAIVTKRLQKLHVERAQCD